MRVLVNAVAAVGPRTGIGHYTSELVRCLREQAGDAAVSAFPPPWMTVAGRMWYRLASGQQPSAPARRSSAQPSWRARVKTTLHGAGQALLTRCFQSASRRGGHDLYHEPNVIPLPCDLPTTTTVHDLSVLLHPEWHPAGRVARYEKHFAAGVARSQHVLTVSEFVRREIIDTLGLSPDRVSTTYNGIRRHLGPLPAERVAAGLRALGLPSRYLLFLGTLEPRKNVRMLLRIYCSLPNWLRERYPLVLVGGQGWNSQDVHAAIEEARPRGVIALGYVADEHLATLYNGARALVFPSFYEGFGLPPVEMLACGGAVLASTAGAVAEVVGGKAHLIDARDGDGWREALLRITTDDDWWKELRRGAEEKARPFTWERCAADTLAVYARVLGGAPAAQQPRAA